MKGKKLIKVIYENELMPYIMGGLTGILGASAVYAGIEKKLALAAGFVGGFLASVKGCYNLYYDRKEERESIFHSPTID